MQAASTPSDEPRHVALRHWLHDMISIRACMVTGVAAILGIFHARSNFGVGILAVDYLLVPVAQILLVIACTILLQLPRKLPRWWLVIICFAGASVSIEITRAAFTMLVLGGLMMQGIFLAIVVLLAWLAAREKFNLESMENVVKGIVILGGLLYGGYAITWTPPLSIYLLFAMLVASWSVRSSSQQWFQLGASSHALKNAFLRLILFSLAITAALILFSMLAVPNPLLFLYPAIAGWAIIALEIIILIRPVTKMSLLVKAMDVLIAMEFLAILLGSA